MDIAECKFLKICDMKAEGALFREHSLREGIGRAGEEGRRTKEDVGCARRGSDECGEREEASLRS